MTGRAALFPLLLSTLSIAACGSSQHNAPAGSSSGGSSTTSSGSGGGAGSGAPINPSNQVVVRNLSGAPLNDYPFQFARPFREGEIPTFPQIWIDGGAVPTQADVKQRWPDGSARHVILSVIIPTLPVGQDVGLEFGLQATGNNTALTTAEMLDPAFDFDARIDIASGGMKAEASARQMLTDGKVALWTSGPIATTVILADHGPTRAYDLGFDTYRSIRPIFEATFWPKTHAVRVRFIGENANTTTLEDVAYDLTLSLGASQPTPIYSRAGLAHYFGTRWTQVAWAPAAPEPDVSVDSGLAYLETTQFFPNFDVGQAIPASLLGANATAWASAKKDLYDPGLWTIYMPTTGGRSDIGPYPGWTAAWLRTGDPGARAVAFGQADLAAAWPLHWREGDATTEFDRKKTIPGIGLPRSVNAHPTLWFPTNNGVYAPILPTPRITDPNAFPTTSGGWAPDGAHQPDPFSPQYILSGEHFYLEEMQLWAAAQALTYAPGAYGRGVDGYGGVQDQIRGNGWVLRSRVSAAFLSPDGSPEKTYFNELVEDALALWEGQRNIQGTPLASHPEWQYGHDQSPVSASPLRFFLTGNPINAADAYGLDTTKASTFEALWMDYYFLIELGIAKERGFPAAGLFTWYAPLLNGQFADPGYDPRLCHAYETPMADVQTKYFTTWAEVASAFVASEISSVEGSFANPSDYYALLASGAGALTQGEAGGEAAWSWLSSNVHATCPTVYPGDWYQWNLVPRAAGTPALPPPGP